jgi:hypothetical protein
MDKTFLNLMIPSLFAISCLALNSSAHADEAFFTLKSQATGKCLHVQGGDQPNGSEIRVIDPCQTTPDFRVESTAGALKIESAPQNFKCLQVKQPVHVVDLPTKVSPGDCATPSNWHLGSPDGNGYREVILTTDTQKDGLCLGEDMHTAEVVVDLCTERAEQKWKLEPVPAP